MKGFLSTFPPHNACGHLVPAGPVQDSGLATRQGRFITPQGLNYLELCKAIISQFNVGLPPSLKRAQTKECGVQVNAKADKIVQCSLGPKTLFCSEVDHYEASKSPRSPALPQPDGKAPCSTAPVCNLRFLRPVSIYSPVFDRKIHPRRPSDDEAEAGATEQAESDGDAEVDQCGEEGEGNFKTTFHRSPKGSKFQVGLLRSTNSLSLVVQQITDEHKKVPYCITQLFIGRQVYFYFVLSCNVK